MPWSEYELKDSGGGEKLERIGTYTIVRPDPRIIWRKKAPYKLWGEADAVFDRYSSGDGRWEIKNPPPDPWIIRYHSLAFNLRPTEFKHIGVFPEQTVNWDWITHTINNYQSTITNRRIRILNLFAYTGGATMAALGAGAEVTHVDSSKGTVDWASYNVKVAGLENKPVRWIIDDAYKFVLRESRRGNQYDGILLDPPRFGRGSKGEVWKLEHDLPKMLSALEPLMSPDFKLFLLNTYTADISAKALENAARDLLPPGKFESGELALTESYAKRPYPCGVYARWTK